MIERWLVFGGWAIDPAVLQPLFGDSASFIDINPLMPLTIDNDALRSDWQDRILITLKPVIPEKPFGIAGWSTGAIIAAALASKINPGAGIFISATPSFCRRREQNFLQGQRNSVLKTMRDQLAVNHKTVLENFYKQCGLKFPPNELISPEINSDTPLSLFRQSIGNKNTCVPSENNFNNKLLADGLVFLENVNLLPLNKFTSPALFLHGKQDSVVPVAAGRYFCAKAGGSFFEYEGPHAFFMNNHLQIKTAITEFAQKVR